MTLFSFYIPLEYEMVITVHLACLYKDTVTILHKINVKVSINVVIFKIENPF